MNMSATASLTESFSSAENNSSADRIWQFVRDELKKPAARQKNSIETVWSFFHQPASQVKPEEFLYDGAGGTKKSTLAAFVKTPESVFVMRQFSGGVAGRPSVSLREVTTEEDSLYEIYKVPGVLRGQIIDNFPPELALAVMKQVMVRDMLPKSVFHGEVVTDFGGRTKVSMDKLRREIGEEAQPSLDSSYTPDNAFG